MKQGLGFALLLVSLLIPAPAQSETVQYIYDDLGRLVGVVDSSGELAVYAYDAVGNLLSITRTGAGQVAIVTFSPASETVCGALRDR